MTLTQQLRYLNLTRNSFHIFFPAKDIVSNGQIIFSNLYVRLKESWSFTGRALLNTGDKLNNLNVNYWKLAKSIACRTKCPGRSYLGPHMARGPRVWDPCTKKLFQIARESRQYLSASHLRTESLTNAGQTSLNSVYLRLKVRLQSLQLMEIDTGSDQLKNDVTPSVMCFAAEI